MKPRYKYSLFSSNKQIEEIDRLSPLVPNLQTIEIGTENNKDFSFSLGSMAQLSIFMRKSTPYIQVSKSQEIANLSDQPFRQLQL